MKHNKVYKQSVLKWRGFKMGNQRIVWVDILKGIGIISIVLWHNGLSYGRYLYSWFHMPLFFYLSGYLFNAKPGFIWSKAKSLLIPYISFMIVVTQLANQPPWPVYKLDALLLGGLNLTGFYGVFWFTTCLFITSTVFYVLRRAIKNEYLLAGAISISYLASYWYSVHYQTLFVPFDAAVALYALVFYYLGYLFKINREKIMRLRYPLFSLALSIIGVFLYANNKGIYKYRMDMKNQIFNQFGIDILLPLCLIFSLILIGQTLQKVFIVNRFLSYIGSASMTIMYLHLPVMIVLRDTYPYWQVVALSILIPIAFYIVVKKFALTRLVFFGEFPTHFMPEQNSKKVLPLE
jgi:fucose 4-O-acetylase-like acetyltransferase